MNAQDYVCDFLEKKFNNVPFNDRNFFEGLCLYVKDNHIDSLFNESDVSKKIIEEFLTPVLNMTEEAMILYFSFYGILKELKRISNVIFHSAENKLKNGIVDDIRDSEAQFMQCVTKLAACDTVRRSQDMLISETLMDIDYIYGKTDKMSMRLSERVI